MKIYQGSSVTPDLESAIIDFVEVTLPPFIHR